MRKTVLLPASAQFNSANFVDDNTATLTQLTADMIEKVEKRGQFPLHTLKKNTIFVAE